MRMFAGVCAAIALAAASSAWAQERAPAEAFGNLPLVEDAALSPDGSKVALAMSIEGQAVVRVVDLSEGRATYSGRLAEGDQLRSIGWADEGRITFMASRTFRPNQMLPRGFYFRGSPRRVDYWRNGVVDLATSQVRFLSTNPDDPWADQYSELIAPIEGDANFARMIGRSTEVGLSNDTVYRVDLRNGRVRPSHPNGVNSDTIDFRLDENGRPIVRIDSDRASNRWRVFVYDDDAPRLLLEGVSDTGAPRRVAGLLEDGRLASIALDEQEEYDVFYAVDRASGDSEVMFRAEGGEVDGAIIDPWTRRVVGVRWTAQEREQRFFDPALQSAYEALRAVFTEGVITLHSWSRDRRRVLAYGEIGLDGGAFYVFTPESNALRRIAYRYPDLDVAGQRQAITYRARDGVRIPAYLTVPANAGANAPLILLPHGGPAGRETMDFDWWASFLASRGYVVLQPNFRGSLGYGAHWERAGWGQWGGLMQTDIEDGVAALGRAGMIDPARVCIVGASYGGYAALAGATLTPDRYRCAVSVAGVADLSLMLQQVVSRTGDDSSTSDYWRLSIGDRREDQARIASVSPVNLAAQVRAPVLLIHGTDDTVVPIDQSRRMLRALQAAGKDVRFVELTGDDHWLSDAETRIQMLREIEAFLAQHLGETTH